MPSNVPFIRDLQRCRRQDYTEATKEVIGTVLLAILPIWLGAAFMVLIPRASVGHYVGDFLSSGEALLISAALIGPSIYVITKRYGDLPRSLTFHFPQGWFLVLLWFMICMIITAIFGLQRIWPQVVPNSHEPLLDVELMQKLSDQAEDHKKPKTSMSVQKAIIQIAIIDIIFSFDSILTAVGLSNQLPIMITAVVISMFVMMFFAPYVTTFITRFPSMKILAPVM